MLSYFHNVFELPNPAKSFVIQKMLQGCQKLRASFDLRAPILPGHLKALKDVCHQVAPSIYVANMLQAIFSLCFFGFLRVGEITMDTQESANTLKFSDVCITGNAMTLTFRSFKHSAGRPFVLSITAQNQDICPLMLLTEYFKLRGSEEGPLFTMPGRMALTSHQFNTYLSDALAAAGILGHFKSHSFRIGAATYAATQGFFDEQIQLMGCWHSNTFKKYIRVASFDPSLLRQRTAV